MIKRATNDPEIKVVLLHGGAAGAFAAGADISEFETLYATRDCARQAGRTIARALDAVESCPKPVIAAIEGPCVGGGLSLAMACDIRIAAENAIFAVPPAKLGLVYPKSDTRRLLQTIGLSATKDLLFTARRVHAQEAKEMGLIERLVANNEHVSTARELALDISKRSQWSVRAIKTMISSVQSGISDEDAEALFLDGFENEDFQDGHKAFLEKRAPRFTFK